jgi:hypothetical protein
MGIVLNAVEGLASKGQTQVNGGLNFPSRISRHLCIEKFPLVPGDGLEL